MSVADQNFVAATGLADPTLAFGLTSVSAWSAGMPFLDLVKTMKPLTGYTKLAGGGLTNEAMVSGGWLDADGWPTSIPDGMSSVRTIWDWSSSKTDSALAATRADVYVLNYEGEGTLKLTGDVTILSSEPGRIVFQNRAGGTMTMDIVTTDPNGTGDYIRDVSIVKEKYETLHEMGEIFNPEWLALVQDARQLRFMDWMDTNGSDVVNWADRPQVDDASWTGGGGVPIEVMVQLANQTGTEPWFNIPVGASDDFIRQFATYVRDHLNPNLQIHVEFANEAWNSALPTYHALAKMSKADWGVSAPMDYFAKRATETALIWDEVFGAQADERVDNVLATQTMNDAIAARAMRAPQWLLYEPTSYVAPGTVFDSLAVTTYFGGSNMKNEALRTELLAAIADPTLDANAWFKARLLDPTVQGSIPQIIAAWEANKVTADMYGLNLIAYEGGQHLLHSFNVKGISEADMNTLVDFMSQFIRSGEMAELYLDLWNAWSEISDGPFMQYGDVSTPSKFGAWGIFSSLGDTNPRAALLADLNANADNWFSEGGGSEYQQGVIKVAGDTGEKINGTDLDDYLIGGAGDDTIKAGKGHDAIAGEEGRDTLILSGQAEDYALNAEGQGQRLSGAGTWHYLRDIEVFRFDDGVELTNAQMLSLSEVTARRLTGTSGNDLMLGASGDDTFVGTLGGDTIIGGFGTDVLDLVGKARNYTLVAEGKGYRLTGEGMSHYLQGVENFTFADGKTYSLDDMVKRNIDLGPLVAAVKGAYLDASDVQEVVINSTAGVTVRGVEFDSALARQLPIDPNSTLAEYTVAQNNATAVFGTSKVGQTYWSMQENVKSATSTAPLTASALETALKLGTVLTGVHELTLTAGDDRFYGAAGAGRTDYVDGGAGADQLYGRRGNDTLLGGGGDDYINGGKGDDEMTGGTGRDSFYIAKGDGHDHITDFTTSDVVDLVGLGLSSRAELTSMAHEDAAGNLVIGDARNSITFDGLHLSDLAWMNITI